MDDIDLDLLGGETDEGVGEGFDRAVHVALDDDVELLEVPEGTTASQLVEGKALLRAGILLTLELLTLAGDATSLLLGLHDVEGLTSGWCAVQTEDEDRCAGASLIDLLVTLVEHSLDTSVVRPG